MSIPCSVCTEISENGDIWPNQKRYWSDTSQTMRAKGYWNNWSRSLPGPYPYADKFFAEVQHFLRYGISQGKEQPHDFRQTREFKVQVWKSAFLSQRIFCGCKGKQAVQTLRRNAVDSGKCANGVQKVCSRFPTQKRTSNLTIWRSISGAPPGTRTLGPLIKSQLLYQLS